MNTDIDDLVRAAVRRQEELAPDPERIRAALPAHVARRARQHRTTALAAVAVAVAAVVVTVPTVVLRDPAGPATPPATGTTDTTSTAAPAPGAVPLRYRPTWLPDGMAERSREVPLTATPDPKLSTVQLWKTTPVGNGPVQDEHIALYAWWSDASTTAPSPPVAQGEGGASGDDRGHVVDVDGRPADVDTDTVTWQVDDHTKLMLVSPGMNLPEADLLRIARSVRPDDTALRSPLRVERLPEGLAPETVAVSGNSPRDWRATFIAEGAGSYVAVSAGTPVTDDVAGETVTVGGRTAHLAQVDMDEPARPTYRAAWVLRVELDHGIVLTVRGGTTARTGDSTLTREDIIAVAEHVVLDPNPDLAWLGR